MLSLARRYRLVTNRLSGRQLRTCFFVTSARALTGRMASISAQVVGGM
jgi:hypothetical protein